MLHDGHLAQYLHFVHLEHAGVDLKEERGWVGVGVRG
jgi:hypothetical protein